jgi:hypothetical protein
VPAASLTVRVTVTVLLAVSAVLPSGCRRHAVPDTSAFERIPAAYVIGTSNLCGRLAFLPEGDPRAFDGGDFIGRAIAVFGQPESGNELVLRHKPTGIVITVYTGSSGPAFGGGPVYPGPPCGNARAGPRGDASRGLGNRRGHR